jgi:hypothetical protein
MKMEGSKESIGDAPWKTASISPVKNAATSTREHDRLDEVTEEALQFVPRKRTNTNHVITPRKPLRQTTLNGHAQTQAEGSPRAPDEKPVRRRKSLRKSIRKSTVPALQEALPDPMLSPATLEPTLNPVQESAASHEVDTKPVLFMVDDSRPASDLLHVDSVAVESGPRLVDKTSDTYQTIKSVVKIPLNDQEDESVALAGDYSVGKLENGYIPEPATYDETQQQLVIETNDQICETIEVEAETHTRPTKGMETPKKRKGPGLRRGTRRSTRNTRASSAKAEEQPAPEVALSVNTDAQSLQPPTVIGLVEAEGGVTEDAPTRTARKTRASSSKVEDQPVTEVLLTVNIGTDPHLLEELVAAEPVAAQGVSEDVALPVTREAVTFANPPKASEDIKLNAAIELPEPETLREQSPIPQVDHSDQQKPLDITSIEPAETETPHPNVARHEVAPEEIQLPASPVELTMVAQEEPPTAWPETNTDVEKVNCNKNDIVEEPQNESQPELSAEDKAVMASPERSSSSDSSPVQFSPDEATQIAILNFDHETVELSPSKLDDETLTVPEVIQPTLLLYEDDTLSLNIPNEAIETLPETSTPDPSTSELIETISENAPVSTYDHDDTDMLRNFLTRVKANKAAKAETAKPKRKRSLPHSPLRLPLGEADANLSPSSPDDQPKSTEDEFDVGLPTPSPTKRRKKNDREQDAKEPTRRSTRLPVIKTPLGAPSFIPVRRLNQDGDTTVTLRRNEEKELAALTRVNTRKNKGGALSAGEVLKKKAEEKEDPALRQRLLKEVFDAKNKGKKSDKRKSVVWAEELAQFQTVGAGVEKKEMAKETDTGVKGEEKKSAASVRVGVKRKIALGNGITGNGTPAPKRRIREKA